MKAGTFEDVNVQEVHLISSLSGDTDIGMEVIEAAFQLAFGHMDGNHQDVVDEATKEEEAAYPLKVESHSFFFMGHEEVREANGYGGPHSGALELQIPFSVDHEDIGS